MRIKTKLVQVILITGLLIAQFIPCAHAWDNNYSQDNTYDSYSQNWQSYKQQNNINTQPAYQQSWWNSAINSVGNFFADVGAAVNRTLNNIGNFFSNIVTSVQNFFVKTPDIKVNEAAASSIKDINTEQPKAIDTGIDKSLSTKNNLSDTAQVDTYKTQTTQKDNPYAYLTAEKACYDPRAAGLSQFSSDYQAIEAEYAARDKWVASQQTQQNSEGKLSETKAVDTVNDIKSPETIDQPKQLNQPAAIPKNTIDQSAVTAITPLQVTPAQADIIPAGSREVLNPALSTVNKTLITSASNDNIQYILDKEVTGIDRNTALTNIKAAFSGHDALSQVSLTDKIKEYVAVVGREKVLDAVFNFFAKGASSTLELFGVKDFLQTSINPTYKTITAYDSQRIFNIYKDFDNAINNGYYVAHSYVSTQYAPGKIESFVNKIGEMTVGRIPIVGNLNLGAPNNGDFVHVAQFVTQDWLGYYHVTQLTYNYGTFKDYSGNYHEGTTFVDLQTYKAEDPNVFSGSMTYYVLEKHERAPLL